MKVLIVDDELAVKEAIELLLDTKICPVEQFLYASNGVRALELLEQEKPDIMFCDMQMPILSGDQLMKEIIHRGYKTQIIAISGFSDFHYVRATMQASGIDYILKPVNPEELNHAYSQAVNHLMIQKKHKEDERDALMQRTERILMQWFAGHRQYGFGVQDVLGKLGFTQDNLNVAAVLFRNSKSIIADIFGENDALFYESLNKSIANCVKRPFCFIAQDEYIHILLFQISDIPANTAVLRRLDNVLRETFRLELLVECTEKAVPCLQIPDVVGHLKGQILQHKVMSSIPGTKATEEPVSVQQLESIFKFLVKEKQIDKIRNIVETFGHRCFTRQDFCLRDIRLITGEMNQMIQRMSDIGEHGVNKASIPVSLWLFNEAEWIESFKSRLYDLAKYSTAKKLSVELVYQYLREHYEENISIGMLTEHFYQSPQYISKQFKERYGITIVTALTAIRMEQARLFLENTDMPMSQICQKTGYMDEGYFSKIFKKENGMSPKQYRQIKQSKE